MALQLVSTGSPDMRILVIEDDADTAAYMVKGLKESGYVVDHAADGRDGMFHAMSGNYDALIVDRMLPNVDGLSIIQSIRTAGIKTPALILSALGAVDDRVKGLKAGGDDYLTKPYAFSELLARIEVMLRRGAGTTVETKLRVADLEMDLLARAVTRGGGAAPAPGSNPSSGSPPWRWTCAPAGCRAAARRSICNRASSCCSNI